MCHILLVVGGVDSGKALGGELTLLVGNEIEDLSSNTWLFAYQFTLMPLEKGRIYFFSTPTIGM